MQRNRTILARMARAMDQAAVTNGGAYKALPIHQEGNTPMGYTVTYQEFAGTSEADHNTIQAFATEDVTLEEVCANCAALRCAAILYDATGFRRGWVHINGEYALR